MKQLYAQEEEAYRDLQRVVAEISSRASLQPTDAPDLYKQNCRGVELLEESGYLFVASLLGAHPSVEAELERRAFFVEAECKVLRYEKVRAEALQVIRQWSDHYVGGVQHAIDALATDHELISMELLPQFELRQLRRILHDLPVPRRTHKKIKTWEGMCRAITRDSIQLRAFGCQLLWDFYKARNQPAESETQYRTSTFLAVGVCQYKSSRLALAAKEVERAAARLMSFSNEQPASEPDPPPPSWPPDDGWHFQAGEYAFGGEVYPLVGKSVNYSRHSLGQTTGT